MSETPHFIAISGRGNHSGKLRSFDGRLSAAIRSDRTCVRGFRKSQAAGRLAGVIALAQGARSLM